MNFFNARQGCPAQDGEAGRCPAGGAFIGDPAQACAAGPTTRLPAFDRPGEEAAGARERKATTPKQTRDSRRLPFLLLCPPRATYTCTGTGPGQGRDTRARRRPLAAGVTARPRRATATTTAGWRSEATTSLCSLAVAVPGTTEAHRATPLPVTAGGWTPRVGVQCAHAARCATTY